MERAYGAGEPEATWAREGWSRHPWYAADPLKRGAGRGLARLFKRFTWVLRDKRRDSSLRFFSTWRLVYTVHLDDDRE